MLYQMLWLVAASPASSPPVPKAYLNWYRSGDMPGYHISKGIARAVGVRVTVRPDGSPQSCEVEDSGGDPNLDRSTCELTMKRARFEPARWADGLPVYGVFRTRVAWAIVASVTPPVPGDLEIELNKLPKGQHSPAYVRVIFAVDPTGNLSSCSAERPFVSGMKASNPELVQVACNELIKNYPPQPARDDKGQAVPSIQNAVVVFIKQRQ